MHLVPLPLQYFDSWKKLESVASVTKVRQGYLILQHSRVQFSIYQLTYDYLRPTGLFTILAPGARIKIIRVSTPPHILWMSVCKHQIINAGVTWTKKNDCQVHIWAIVLGWPSRPVGLLLILRVFSLKNVVIHIYRPILHFFFGGGVILHVCGSYFVIK